MTGVFDSGVGGLCALRELLRLYPEEDYIYLADTAHLPYGARTRSEVLRYTAEALCFFAALGVERVLLACGTASVSALEFCQKSFPFPIHGIAEHAAYAAANATKSLHIGVIATQRAIESGIYTRLISAYCPASRVTAAACPSLVALAEAGADRETVFQAIRRELAPLEKEKIDTLLLGCTHFSLLKEGFADALPHVTLIDGAAEGARGFAAAFLPEQKKKKGSLRLFVTESPRAFEAQASRILGKRVRVEKAL